MTEPRIEGAERLSMMWFNEIAVNDDDVRVRNCRDCGVPVMTYPPEDGNHPNVRCGRCNGLGIATVERTRSRPPVLGRPASTALYRFYSSLGELLYVGISHHLESRMSKHKREKPWDEIARIDIEHYDSRRAALDAERQAIETEHPLWNIVHQAGTR